MTEAEQRAAVVEETRLWLRTPYHNHARLRGVGVDCAQLPIAVYSAVGLIEAPSPSYTPDWALHRGEEVFAEWVLRYAREIDRELLGPGDLCLWRYGRAFSHAAIVISPPLVVHACLGRGVETARIDGDEQLRTRPMRCFSLWGVDNGE